MRFFFAYNLGRREYIFWRSIFNIMHFFILEKKIKTEE